MMRKISYIALQLAASQIGLHCNERKTEFISTSTNVYDLKSIKKLLWKEYESLNIGTNIHDSEKDLKAIDFIEFGNPIKWAEGADFQNISRTCFAIWFWDRDPNKINGKGTWWLLYYAILCYF